MTAFNFPKPLFNFYITFSFILLNIKFYTCTFLPHHASHFFPSFFLFYLLTQPQKRVLIYVVNHSFKPHLQGTILTYFKILLSQSIKFYISIFTTKSSPKTPVNIHTILQERGADRKKGTNDKNFETSENK